LIDCTLFITIEPALAVLSACLPTLRPVIPTKKIHNWYSGVSGSRSQSGESKKSRGSWFVLDPRSSGSSRAGHGTSAIATANESDDVYPLKALDRYEIAGFPPLYELQSTARGSRNKRDIIQQSLPPDVIRVRNDFSVVNEISVLDR
jgi:hypothetical protein